MTPILFVGGPLDGQVTTLKGELVEEYTVNDGRDDYVYELDRTSIQRLVSYKLRR